ncbi:MAG TPA: mandelate racemase/muconate lactonizing enzyme family protein, partial [Clostridia bacterium]|nr:mandelate racemase/muconate lactonizing enzyme family protein [Clostridia bacterium]
MKITSVTPYLFFPGAAKNLLLCRVETDEGIYGWGEAYVVQGKEKAVETYINGMAQYMTGRSPFNIKHSGQAMFDDFAIRRSSCDFYAAWSAIEIAMWDIVGKAAGQPVYNLLGGASRERIRVYANGWWGGASTVEETVERALKVKAMGFTALKWDPFLGYWRNSITRKQEDYAVENVKAVREALGPDVDLLIEVHRRLSPYHAAHFADRIAECDPFWLEEPCLADNLDLVVEAKKNIRMPLVTGETKYSKYEYKEVFEKRAAEIINPDTCVCNGILGMLEIASMAEPYSVLLSPHNFNSTVVGMAATVHVSAVASNFLIAEMFLNIKEGCDAIAVNPLKLDNGFIDLPAEPGLGVDINMEELLKRPYKVFERKFPFKGAAQYYDEFPRKEDYI